jgi:transcriptional regulator with XRE-family HTH domain
MFLLVKAVGEMLRQVRASRQLSMRAVARMAGLPHSYLSDVETGKVSPSIDTLTKLCRWYGIEPWEAVLGMTRAELIASLPAPPTSPLRAELDAIIKKHGEDGARALLLAAERAPDAETFALAVRMFKAAAREGEA